VAENIDGVETLEIYTKYRARIAVGYAFDDIEVRQNVEDTLCPKSEPGNTKLTLVKKYLASKYKYWAIFKLNGNLDSFGSDTIEDVTKEVSKRKELCLEKNF